MLISHYTRTTKSADYIAVVCHQPYSKLVSKLVLIKQLAAEILPTVVDKSAITTAISVMLFILRFENKYTYRCTRTATACKHVNY